MLHIDHHWSGAEIGRRFDGRDHSTVHKGIAAIERRLRHREEESRYLVTTLREGFAEALDVGYGARRRETLDLCAAAIAMARATRDTLAATGAVVDQLEATARETRKMIEAYES